MPHQEEVLKRTEGFPSVGHFLDMGLGKTYTGAEALMRYGTEANLAVCQLSKVSDWIEHFQKNYDVEVFDLTCSTELEAFLSSSSRRVGVINYDIVFRRPELKSLSGFSLLLDESSLIQNEKTKRAKFLLALKPEHTVLLSGTVVNGAYERLWSQCRFLGWTISRDTFWRHYVETRNIMIDGFWRKVPTGRYRNVERLKAKLARHGAVFMNTEDVLELPDTTIVQIEVPPSAEYLRFAKSGIVTVNEKTLVGDMGLTERMYKRMLCGHFSDEKAQAFADLLESTNDRLIVFYTFTAELERLRPIAEASGRTISIVNGQTKDLAAYEDDPTSVTFCQWQAGAMGLNLQKANKVIFYTLPDGWSEGFEQAKKRVHRIGQERPCFYYLLTVKGSIEEEIYKTLGRKRLINERLFDG
jgi:SNF2 family DNA or RNA helicase